MGMVIDGKQVKNIVVDEKLVKNVWSNDTLLWTAIYPVYDKVRSFKLDSNQLNPLWVLNPFDREDEKLYEVIQSVDKPFLQIGEELFTPSEWEMSFGFHGTEVTFLINGNNELNSRLRRLEGNPRIRVWDKAPHKIKTMELKYISSFTNRFFVYFDHRPKDILDYKEMEVGGIRVSLMGSENYRSNGIRVLNKTEAMKLRKGISHSDREFLFRGATATFFK